MLGLRQYKPCDADIIASWIKDEISFRKWCADRFESYPVTGADINKKYIELNGDCSEPDNFYPMTAFDESGIVGHLIMRYTDEAKKAIRFGFIILDDTKRGKGYGKEMLRLSLKYAFEIMKADKVTLGVFENNPSAYYCYKAAGLKEIASDEPYFFHIMGENWKCLEMEVEK